MRLTFLGTGTSFGVPQVGCDCAVCHSADPRDKRYRSAAVIEVKREGRPLQLLIDTPPELRLQLVRADIATVDAVLYTHEHADHIHGIDDLRAITIRRRAPLSLYGDEATLRTLSQRFPYIVDAGWISQPGTSRPKGLPVVVRPGEEFEVEGMRVMPFAMPHGHTSVLGYRIGDIGYVTDAKSLPGEALSALQGVRVLVLNALLRKPHPSHLSISEAVDTARRIGARQTWLTHLTHDQFHTDLAAELPDGISPAFDGLVVDVPGHST